MSIYVAKRFVAGSPQAEIRGKTMVAYIDNIKADETTPLMYQFGIQHLDPTIWYPHQLWMDILKALWELPNGSENCVAFGKKAVETAALPSNIATVSQALDVMNQIHHLNVRNIPD